MDTQTIQSLLVLIVKYYGGLMEFMLQPRDLGVFGNVSMLSIMLGSGLTVYLVYQFVTWVVNLVT